MGPLGLKYRNDFFEILRGDREGINSIKDTLCFGLEHFQGIWRKKSSHEQNLCLVDPAFLPGRTNVSIISRKLKRNKLEVLSEGEYWRKFGPEKTECYEDIMDWNPRMIRLILSDSEKFKEEGIEVNLSTFEFLCRLSSGLTLKGEHLASFNRIEDRLMSWSTEKEPDPDEPITVCLDGKLRQLILDDQSRIVEVS